MKSLKDNLQLILLIASVITVAIGGVGYFASAKDLKAVEGRVQQAELELAYLAAIRTLDFYVSQCRKYPQDQDLKRRLDDSQRQVERLESLLKLSK